jgi:hypothetical protein
MAEHLTYQYVGDSSEFNIESLFSTGIFRHFISRPNGTIMDISICELEISVTKNVNGYTFDIIETSGTEVLSVGLYRHFILDSESDEDQEESLGKYGSIVHGTTENPDTIRITGIQSSSVSELEGQLRETIGLFHCGNVGGRKSRKSRKSKKSKKSMKSMKYKKYKKSRKYYTYKRSIGYKR